MSGTVLYLPRRLAIRLLAEAQKAGDGSVHGWIGARGQQPASVNPGARAGQEDEAVWASYRSRPSAAGDLAPPDLGGLGETPRHLAVSVDTKGVLQLRCWEREGGRWQERILKISD